MKLGGIILDRSRFYFGTTGRAARAYHIELHFCWYDLWIGAYWAGGEGKTLYVCPLPMLAIKITFAGQRKKRTP